MWRAAGLSNGFHWLWVDFLILFSVQEVVLSRSTPGNEPGRVLLGNGKLTQARAQTALPLRLWRPRQCLGLTREDLCVQRRTEAFFPIGSGKW